MSDPPTCYALAMGSNKAWSARLHPRALLDQAAAAVAEDIGPVLARSRTYDTAPLGPSRRRYANNAMIVESVLSPPAMLAAVQAIEARFGRRRARRWGTRTLDIDIILWSGGRVANRRLNIPHAAFADREFVLGPLVHIASSWRDPRSGLSIAHMHHRLQKPQRRG